MSKSIKSKLDKLEKMRGFICLYVFAGHFLAIRILQKQSYLGFCFRFGQEAVMLFFLISGFVIYYSTSLRDGIKFPEYFHRRFQRIYPIFLLALILSIGLCFCNQKIQTISITQLLGNLFMLQDFRGGKPGIFIDPLCGNLPLWSLSYEWWFYMLFFPIYHFIKASYRLHFAAGLSLLGFATYFIWPNQISLFMMYFILWWSGAELARTFLTEHRITLYSQRWTIFYVIVLCACMVWQVLNAATHHKHLSFGLHPVLELRHFSACLLILIVGILWSRINWLGFDALFKIFAPISSISYALYVLHYPLAVQSVYLKWIPCFGLQMVGYVAITFIVAYLAEIFLQFHISRWLKSKLRT